MDENEEVQKVAAKSDPKAKVIKLRETLVQQVGNDPSLKAADFKDLSAEDQVKVTNQMREIIEANPDIYGEERADLAADLGEIPNIEKRTIGDNVKAFGKEFAEQAKSKGNSIFFIAATVTIIAGVFTIARPFLFKNK